MKIQPHHSLEVAQAVIASLEALTDEVCDLKILAGIRGVDLQLGSYQNGREQGVTIAALGLPFDTSLSTTVYSIAQDRGSDEIVVYVGPIVHQAIGDDTYENHRHTFPCEDYYAASKFIFDDMVTRLSNM